MKSYTKAILYTIKNADDNYYNNLVYNFYGNKVNLKEAIGTLIENKVMNIVNNKYYINNEIKYWILNEHRNLSLHENENMALKIRKDIVIISDNIDKIAFPEFYILNGQYNLRVRFGIIKIKRIEEDGISIKKLDYEPLKNKMTSKMNIALKIKSNLYKGDLLEIGYYMWFKNIKKCILNT